MPLYVSRLLPLTLTAAALLLLAPRPLAQLSDNATMILPPWGDDTEEEWDETMFGTGLATTPGLSSSGGLIIVASGTGGWGASRVDVFSKDGEHLHQLWVPSHGPYRVAGLGDVNGDGVDDVAVGAPHAREVYLYSGATGTRLRTIEAPFQDDYEFGAALARVPSAGGATDLLLVGAPGATAGGVHRAGRAWLFDAASGAIVRAFTRAGAVENGAYGHSLAVASGIDPGGPSILIGAPGDSVGEYPQAGRVYAYAAADGSHPLQREIVAPDARAEGRFGTTLAGAWGGGAIVGGTYGAYEVSLSFGQLVVRDLGLPAGGAVAAVPGLDPNGGPGWVAGPISTSPGDAGGAVDLVMQPQAASRTVRRLAPPPRCFLLFEEEVCEGAVGFGAAMAALPDLTGDGRGGLLISAPDSDNTGLTSANGSPADFTRGRVYLYRTGPAAPPVAADDAASMLAGDPSVLIDVVRNDADPAGWGLAITDFGQPAHGQVHRTGTPTHLSYHPPAGFTGQATFPYTVTDINGQGATATVTVTVRGGAEGPPGWTVYTTANSGLPSNTVTAAAQGPEGDLWFGTLAGLARQAPGGAWVTRASGELNRRIRDIAFPDRGSSTPVVAATPDGLLLLDAATGEAELLGTGSGLPSASVHAVLAHAPPDASARGLWVGTAAGLVLLDVETRSVTPIVGGDVRAVAEDAGGGTVWAAVAPNTAGVEPGVHEYVRSGGGWTFSAFYARPNVGLCLENATAMAHDGTHLRVTYLMYGPLPGGTDDACTPEEAGSSRPARASTSPRPRPRMARYDGATWVSSGPVLAQRASPDGGVADGGFPDGLITDLAHGGGVVWLAARPADGEGGGLAFAFTGGPEISGGWTVFRAADPAVGLPSDEVLAVTVDAGGAVWAGTASGLARYEPPLAAPMARAPAVAEAVPRTPLIQWDRLSAAQTHRIQVATDAGFGAVVREWTAPGGEARLAVGEDEALDAHKAYYWRIRAEAGQDASFWSPAQPFTTGAAFARFHELEGVAVRPATNEVWGHGPDQLYRYAGGEWEATGASLQGWYRDASGRPQNMLNFPWYRSLSVAPDGSAWAAAHPSYEVVGPDAYTRNPAFLSRLHPSPLHTWGDTSPLTGFEAVAAVDAETAWACAAEFADPPSVEPRGPASLVRRGPGGLSSVYGACQAVAAAADGTAWAVGGQLVHADASGVLATRTVPLAEPSAVAVAPDGRVWVGTAGAGVAVFDPGAGTWTSLTPAEYEGLAATVHGFAFAGEAVWLATSAGLVRQAGGAWAAWPRASAALPSDRVTAVAAQADGTVWATTPEGTVELRGLAVGGVTAEGGAPSEAVTLAVYPNPVRARGTVALAHLPPGRLTVEVLDVLGRRVRVLHEGEAAGSLVLPLSEGGLAGGLYVVRARGDGFALVQRVTVAR